MEDAVDGVLSCCLRVFAVRRAMCATAVLAVVALSNSLQASEPNASAAAEALFREGRALMASGKVAEGCAKLAASQRLDPGAGTLLNLAACYRLQGRTATAWATYQEAAASANHSGRTDWELQARTAAAEIEPSLSYLTIQVPNPAQVQGLVVERDGQPIDSAEWGSAIPVDPGSHAVKASAPGRAPFSKTVDATAQPNRFVVTIPVLDQVAPTAPAGSSAPAVAPLASSPPPATDTSNSMKTVGLVLGGVGLVGLGIGTWLGLSAKSNYNDALDQCDAQRRCSSEGLSLNDKAHDRAMWSTIAFGVGAASLAAGAVVYFTAPKSAGERTNVAATITPTPQGMSVALRAQW